MKDRWITLGTVRSKYVRIRNWGVPNGLQMDWKGRVAWCQPTEFLNWSHLIEILRNRFNCSHLQMVGLASRVPRGMHSTEATLICLVRCPMAGKHLNQLELTEQ